MELLVLLIGILLSLAVVVVLRRSTRRARAQRTLHQVRDAAVAHRALHGNADAFTERPVGIFPAILGTGRRRGERNETIVTVPHGPHWRALRCNLTAGTLHPSRIASLASLQQDTAHALLAVLLAKVQGEASVIVIRGDLNAAAFSLLARMCFGDGVEERIVRSMEGVIQELFETVGELIPVLDGSLLAQVVHWRQLRRLMGFLGRQTELYLPLIEARRQAARSRDCGGGVYVDSLLDLRIPNDDCDGGRRVLRDDELISLVSEFLGSGSGSMVACVEWTIAHLIGRPEVQSKLRREIDRETANDSTISARRLRTGMPYMHAVVLESLRMQPPAPHVMRGVHDGDAAAAVIGASATTDVPADGFRVQFVLSDIGRDSNAWTDPDEFLPGGEAEGVGPYPGPKEIRMLPFGTAQRHCPGTSFAMLQIKCFLAVLVREFEWAPSAEDCVAGIDMTERDGFFKVMKTPLSALVTRRRTYCTEAV